MRKKKNPGTKPEARRAVNSTELHKVARLLSMLLVALDTLDDIPGANAIRGHLLNAIDQARGLI